MDLKKKANASLFYRSEERNPLLLQLIITAVTLTALVIVELVILFRK